MMDWYVVWLVACGIPVQAWICWKLGKFIGAAAGSCVCAISVCRWGVAVGREHGFRRSPWLWVPIHFFGLWWDFTTDGVATVIESRRGKWRGVGNWVVYPKREAA